MKKLIGAVLLLAGVALFELCVFHLTQVGSCQSGGSQVIRVPCPHSTWTWLPLTLPALLAGLIGAAILDIVAWAWALGWMLSGVVAIVAVYSPGAHAGSKQGGVIVGIVWIVLGLFFSLFAGGIGTAKSPEPAGPPPG